MTNFDVAAQLQISDGGVLRTLTEADLASLPTGAATETSVASVAAAAGTTSDASSATTLVGLLKAIKAAIVTTASNFLAVRLTDGTSYLNSTAGRLQVSDGGVALSTTVSNFPSSTTVSNFPSTQTVAGTVGLPPAVGTAFADAGTITAGTYRGVTVKNTSTSATAEITIRNNNVSGLILDTITLAGNESVRETYPSGRTAASGTIYMQLVSGAVTGTVFAS